MGHRIGRAPLSVTGQPGRATRQMVAARRGAATTGPAVSLGQSSGSRPRRCQGKAAGRCFIVGLLVLAATLVAGPSAQASVPIGPEVADGKVPGSTIPGPEVPPPNVFPLPPPPPIEPGFTPAPGGPGPLIIIPAPDLGVSVHDGPGTGPVDAPPIRIEADTPSDDAAQPSGTGSAGVPEPAGKLSRVDDKYLKRSGVDPHAVKDENDLRPPSRFDIYVDEDGNMFGVRKGNNPKLGEFLGNILD